MPVLHFSRNAPGDLHEPGAKSIAFAKCTDRPKGFDEDLLCGVLAGVHIREKRSRDAPNRPFVASDQRLKSGEIAIHAAPYQIGIRFRHSALPKTKGKAVV